MYKIGELSKLCRLTVKTLRFYDSEGLLVPDEIDRFTGYRYYSAARLADCNHIVALKELVFSLDEIKRHMKASEPDDITALIDSKRTELELQLKFIAKQLRRLDSVRLLITEGEKNMFEMVLRSNDTLRVAAKRQIYASKTDAEAEIIKIKSELPKNVVCSRSVIINYETEYRESDFDLAACVELAGNLPSGSGYESKTISLSGDVAVLVCNKGNLAGAYNSITRQLDETNYQVIGAFYEIYHDDGTVELKVPVCKTVKNDGTSAVIPPFENDPEVIGKWKLIDIVPSKEQFIYGSSKATITDKFVFNELYFLAKGEKYWIVEGWSKGILFTSAEIPERHSVANKYEIETAYEHKILFVGMTHIDCNGMTCDTPPLWVYEKVSDNFFKTADIKIRDNIDYPFIPDESVVGKWIVRDFYANSSVNFDAVKHNRNSESLYVRSVEFTAGGKRTYITKHNEFTVGWTKGLVLNHYTETASAYKIVNAEGKKYLLLEWKSGDYTFGGKANCYIFVRE